MTRQTLKAELTAVTSVWFGAVARLSALAKRRQVADDTVLVSLRTVISGNWDIPPGDWPNERSEDQQGSYTYDMEYRIVPAASGHSAKELMDLFKAHPEEILPFIVKGSPGGFRDGEVFELSETLPLVQRDTETGLVAVETTETSVKFTVVSDGYFAGPGSTIEFSIVERDGWLSLRKVADAKQAEHDVASIARFGAGLTWLEQAQNFWNVVNEQEK